MTYLALFSIIIIIHVQIISITSQNTFCYNSRSCVGQSIVKSSGSVAVYGYGYKSLEGSTTSVTVSYAATGSASAWCGGAFACHQINYIVEANSIACFSSNACAEVNETKYLRLTASSEAISCYGSNGCRYSNLQNTYTPGNTVHCYGDAGCRYATLSGIRSVYVYAAYGFYGATYDSAGNDYNPTISLHAYHAGFGGTYRCDPDHTCTIDCYGNGCSMLYIDCPIGNCVVNTQSVDTVLPITNLGDFDSNELDELYDSEILTLNNEQSCNGASATTFDDYQENNAGSDIIVLTSTQTPICCRGEESCQGVTTIEIDTASVDSVVCSGMESCKNSGVLNSNGPVFCEGYNACSGASITTSDNVYCLAQGACEGATITGASNVFCAGSNGCYNTIFTSNGNNMNVYFLGKNSGSSADVYCSTGDTCLVFCGGAASCTTTELFCDGATCTVDCLLELGCPILPTTDPSTMPTTAVPSANPSAMPTTTDPTRLPTTTDPTKMPTTTNPTKIPTTTDPTANPSINPSVNPSLNPTTIAPTVYPTVYPTIYPTVEPTYNPTVEPSDMSSSVTVSSIATEYIESTVSKVTTTEDTQSVTDKDDDADANSLLGLNGVEAGVQYIIVIGGLLVLILLIVVVTICCIYFMKQKNKSVIQPITNQKQIERIVNEGSPNDTTTDNTFPDMTNDIELLGVNLQAPQNTENVILVPGSPDKPDDYIVNDHDDNDNDDLYNLDNNNSYNTNGADNINNNVMLPPVPPLTEGVQTTLGGNYTPGNMADDYSD